jgi:hypothetical protein
MSSSLTDLQAKQNALKERKTADKRIAMEVDQIAKKYIVDDDIAQPLGCFPRLLSCGGAFFHKRQAVATSEHQTSSLSTASTNSSTKSNAIMDRLVGKSKKQAAGSESMRMDSAMEAVQARLEGLSDRLKMAKQKAMAASKAGKKTEALREMKKVKAAQKQFDTAQAALEALERQADALAQTSLQKELATALASTNKQMKQKSKGLLSFAEQTIDDAIEVADEAEDVAQVFEGLMPGGSTAYDDDDLRGELDAMIEEEEGDADMGAPAGAGAAQPEMLAAPATAAFEHADKEDFYSSFPAAARGEVEVGKGSKVKEDRQALLSH